MSGVAINYSLTSGGNQSAGISIESYFILKKMSELAEHFCFPASRQSTKEKFYTLMRTWKKEVLLLSSTTKIVTHPSYQRIIGMGQDVIPLILREFEREPNHWSWALRAITGEDPVALEDRGNLMKIREAWLKWGKEHGYIE